MHGHIWRLPYCISFLFALYYSLLKNNCWFPNNNWLWARDKTNRLRGIGHTVGWAEPLSMSTEQATLERRCIFVFWNSSFVTELAVQEVTMILPCTQQISRSHSIDRSQRTFRPWQASCKHWSWTCYGLQLRRFLAAVFVLWFRHLLGNVKTKREKELACGENGSITASCCEYHT